MMHRRDDDVAHAGPHGEVRQRVGIELRGGKSWRQGLVLRERNLFAVHGPLRPAKQAVQAIMDKEAVPPATKVR